MSKPIPGQAADPGVIARAASGDQDAFYAIYGLYFDRVYGYLTVALRSAADAEVVAAEAFNALRAALPEFDPSSGDFTVWLFGLARACAVAHLRETSPEELRPSGSIASRRRARLSGARARSELKLDGVPDGDCLLVLERLPFEQRQIVMLRFMAGLDLEQTAFVVRRNLDAVADLEEEALGALAQGLGRLAAAPGP